MSMSVLSECLAELGYALTSLRPELTGLVEQRLLPNAEATNAALDAQIALFTHRQRLLEAAADALIALQNDGYPVVPMRDVPEEVYAELQSNAEEVLAALEHFRQMARLIVPQKVDVEVQYAETALVPASDFAPSPC
jgi:hypothetical protein